MIKLRHISGSIASRVFKPGDEVQFFDKTPSPFGLVPNALNEKKAYKVIETRDKVIKILNENGWETWYYANRFKKI